MEQTLKKVVQALVSASVETGDSSNIDMVTSKYVGVQDAITDLAVAMDMGYYGVKEVKLFEELVDVVYNDLVKQSKEAI